MATLYLAEIVDRADFSAVLSRFAFPTRAQCETWATDEIAAQVAAHAESEESASPFAPALEITPTPCDPADFAPADLGLIRGALTHYAATAAAEADNPANAPEIRAQYGAEADRASAASRALSPRA